MRFRFLLPLVTIAVALLAGCKPEESTELEDDPLKARIGSPSDADPKKPPPTGLPPRPDVPPPGARLPASTGGAGG